jgi:hypothetical protein
MKQQQELLMMRVQAFVVVVVHSWLWTAAV